MRGQFHQVCRTRESVPDEPLGCCWWPYACSIPVPWARSRFENRGAAVVDGGIVGPPPRDSGTTRLYLSGPDDAVRQVSEVLAAAAILALLGTA
ncbi:MAG: hypothetical protein ACRDTA_03455 [Pseudonocardiaceae bacterium]